MPKYWIGVSKRRGKYRARITVDGKTHSLGTFNTEQDAAMEYDNAARKLRGQDATKLNFPGLKMHNAEPVTLSLKEPIWVSSDGRQTPISLLANNHLRNIERMLRYRGAQIPAKGTQAHWYVIIANELHRRELEPLEDHPNQIEETVEIPVYAVSPTKRKKSAGHALIDISFLPFAQKYPWYESGIKLYGRAMSPVRILASEGRYGPIRSLDSYVTGNVKYPVIHRNGDPRDCTRKNLVVEETTEAKYKLGADNRRDPLPQGGSGHADVTPPGKPETIISGEIIKNPPKKDKKMRAAKGQIKARFSNEV